MFYAPLLAALWGRVGTAVAVALLAPWLNWALTGHPAPRGAVVMTIELPGFVVALRFLLANVGARWFLALPAYLSSKTATALGAALLPALVDGQSTAAWTVQSVTTGLPGIAILVLINWLALRFYPPSFGGRGPTMA